MNPVVTLPCLSLDAESARVVVVRREQPRAVLEDGSPVPLIFGVSASSVVPDGFCSKKLFQVAEATYENLKGRRLAVDGVMTK